MKDYTKYIGTRWSYPDNDCIAVVKKILANEFNTRVHDIDIEGEWKRENLVAAFKAERDGGKWQKVGFPFEGAAVLFYSKTGDPFHIGLMVSSDSVIHCPGTPQCPGQTLIERLKDMPNRIYGRFEYYAYNPNH